MVRERLRALVVDDHYHHREILRAILAAQGLAVDFALDGAQAVAVAKAIGFDLILMDMDMPVMDGLTATRLIREFEQCSGRRRSRLFVVSSNGDSVDQARSREAGADGHMTKPVQVAGIVRFVEQCERASPTPDASFTVEDRPAARRAFKG